MHSSEHRLEIDMPQVLDQLQQMATTSVTPHIRREMLRASCRVVELALRESTSLRPRSNTTVR
ncbi:MAG: hypothetical protein KDA58_07005 [Planctomycetaceae bacterium]|nr:hypothetical protein [Planctomycetaceae bacterium]